jgi:polar amino acid transport system substrate-binding protein
MAGEPFNLIKVGIATRKDNAELHNALTAALETVQKSGEYDAILKEWNLSGDSIFAH